MTEVVLERNTLFHKLARDAKEQHFLLQGYNSMLWRQHMISDGAVHNAAEGGKIMCISHIYSNM